MTPNYRPHPTRYARGGECRHRWAGVDQRPMTPRQNGGTARRLTGLGLVLAAQTLLLLSACAVHRPYPEAAWGPLPPPPSADCRYLEGSYRNRGEVVGHEAQPSLALELFGRLELVRADRVSLSFPTSETVNVTVWEATRPVFARTLTSPGDFVCKGGRMVVRARRFLAESAVSGWQSVTITLSGADDYLVGQVEEVGVGLVFLVLPVGGETTSWYRFRRERD